MKLAFVPFPFPYAQTCDCLLTFHWICVPFVTCQWVSHSFWAFLFVFIQVFILWSLNFIAVEIENPFGTDANDLDGRTMQEEMNHQLLVLLDPSTIRTPKLSATAVMTDDPTDTLGEVQCQSFRQVWSKTGDETVMAARRTGFPAGRGPSVRSSIVRLDADVGGNNTRNSTMRASLCRISECTAGKCEVFPICEGNEKSVACSVDDEKSSWNLHTPVNTQDQIDLKGSWEPAVQPAMCSDNSVEAPSPCGHTSMEAHSQISGAERAPSGEDKGILVGYLLPAPLSSYHPPARDDDCRR